MEIVGGLKLGRKKLKIYHLQSNAYLDIEPMCCLDFFVTPRLQRQGVGHHIFEVNPRIFQWNTGSRHSFLSPLL